MGHVISWQAALLRTLVTIPRAVLSSVQYVLLFYNVFTLELQHSEATSYIYSTTILV